MQSLSPAHGLDDLDLASTASGQSPSHLRDSPETPVNLYHRTLPLSPEQALKRVGSQNRFQVFLSVIMALSFATVGHISYGLAYLENKKLPITCYGPDGSINTKCDAHEACDASLTSYYEIRLDSETKSLRNWVYDFDLLCVSDSSLSWLGTSFFIGFLIGSAVFMWLSDIVGRKIIIQIGLILHIVILLFVLYVRSLAVLFIFLFVFGLRVPMAAHVGSLMTYEMVSQRVRSYATSVLTILDGTTNVWLPVFFFYAKDWRILFWGSIGLVVIIFFLITFLIPESPRILISRKKFAKARQSYKFISRFNKKEMFTEPIQGEDEEPAPIDRNHRNQVNDSRASSWISRPPRPSQPRSEDYSPALLSPDDPSHSEIVQNFQQQPQQRRDPNSCANLLKSKLRSQLVIIPLLFFFVDIVFYGILFGLKNLKGNIYINGLMVGGADLCAGISLAFLSNIIGRRGLIKLTWAVCGIACLIYNSISSYQIAQYIVVLFGKYGATCSFSLMFLISSETFPTAVRGKMVGICNACARVGGAIAPLVNGYLGEDMMYVFGALAAVSFILSFFLRETKSALIQDDLEDMAEKKLNFTKGK